MAVIIRLNDHVIVFNSYLSPIFYVYIVDYFQHYFYYIQYINIYIVAHMKHHLTALYLFNIKKKP